MASRLEALPAVWYPVFNRFGVDLNAVAARRLLAVAMLLSQGCQKTRPVGPAPDAAPSPRAEPAAREARVAASAGRVERLRGTSWALLAAGERVQAHDALRTAADGRADLDIGARAHVHVAENTQVHLDELTETIHRFRLARGRLAAEYEPDGERVVRIEDAAGGAAAEARAGHFSALSTPGSFAVSAQTGAVNLRAAGVSVRVAPGEQSVASEGRAPSPSAALPRALLLKVAAAGGALAPCSAVEGTAALGAELLVDGESAPTDSLGRFRAEPRKKGAEVQILARDASGRVEERLVRCPDPAPTPTPRIEEMRIRWRD
jgi:hypothetical protein